MTMTNEDIRNLGEQHVMNTYGRTDFALVRGRGTRVWDADGNEYLDMLAGIAVNVLGHCPPEVTDALCDQANTLMHTSNLYWTEPQVLLARELCQGSGLDKVFFCNSGAEANEGAIKLARKYGADHYGPERHVVVTMEKSFHGRTLATLKATGQPKFHEDFGPHAEGFRYVPLNDWEALLEAVDDAVCAVMIEPVQGEGGVFPVDRAFLQKLEALCRERDILLILDEVQCGFGRSGHLFAFQNYGVTPDVMTLAKGLGGGVPIGAFLASDRAAASLGPGKHGSTFGGNPLVCAAALAVMTRLNAPGFLESVNDKSAYFKEGLEALAAKHPVILEIRGLGLMIGVKLSVPGAGLVKEAASRGLLINCTDTDTLRFLPPLTVSPEEIDEAIAILDGLLSGLNP